jgi:subtilase family serine protease
VESKENKINIARVAMNWNLDAMKIKLFGKLPVFTSLALFFLSAQFIHAEQKTLIGQMPAAVANLTAIHALPAATHLNLAIGLPLRNQAALNALLAQIYDPASPNFHHYLTPEQFTAQFGPSQEDYQKVLDFAQTNGLAISTTYSNRLLVDVGGAASDINKAFHITLRTYQHPTENRTFYAPSVNPTVDASLPILHVGGLDNYSLPHPNFKAKPLEGTGTNGLYLGYDFRKAYVPGFPLTGTGQTVGLLEFDGFYPNDITQYVTQAGLPTIPLQIVKVDGGVSTPGDGNVEVALDIDMVMAMAPGLSQIVIYEAPNDISLWEDLLNQMADDTAIKQFSCSWGGGSANPTAEQIFKKMAAQGQTFFNAVGDSDAFTGSISFPSDSPNITEVGGTTLTTSSAVAWKSEKVWNWGGGVGSSGGISTTYSIPSWQQGIDMSGNQGSTSMRNVPDVALTADEIYIIADNGLPQEVGGTSAAAPLWAAFIALVNQQSGASGSTAGFINPAIYAIATSSSYAADFHDVITGNNFSPNSPSQFSAVPGFDLCTGLGTPNGINLINALAGKAPRTGILQLTVDPSSGSTLLNSSTQTVFVTVNDGGYDVTNATVTAAIAGITNLTLLNDGNPPDVYSNDAIYSAAFQVPAGVSSLTMTVTASATNEIGATNVIYYSAVPLPPNDNFSSATKVPAVGGAYVSNNKFATIETNEPAHDGDTNAAASLWWNWTPLANTNVFIDTIGSKIDTVLAVYTGSSLITLTSVAATNGSVAQYKPAYVNFNAQANVTYHIAVASVSSNSLGSLVLHITPGGKLDTVPPTVTVTSPLSGQTVTSQTLVVSGTAIDPLPNPSGVIQVVVSVNGVSTTATGTTNWTVPIILQPELNVISVTAVDAAGNFSSPTSIQVNYLVPTVANDFFARAIVLNGTSGSVSIGNTNATKETGEPDITGNAGGKSVWWSFTPTADGVLTLNTTNSTFDTLLGLYTGTDVADLTTIAENDDAYPGAPGGFSFINQAVRANQIYDISVDGYDGAAGTVFLSYSFAPLTVYHLIAGNTSGGTVQLTVTNILGGINMVPGQSGDFAAGSAVTLSAIPNATGQFTNWSGNVSSLNNPLTVVMQTDLSLTANFVSLPFTDGFESGDLSHLSWTTAGDAPWFVQTNIVAQGQYAARSGVIADSQTSSLILTTNFNAGIGSFDYKVSSEMNWDFLNFYVDGVLYKQWSGEVGWANYSFALNPGLHTLKWTYAKDPSDSSGLDAAFLDDLNLPISFIPPPQLQLHRQSDGTFLMTITGQGNGQYITQTSTNLVDWVNYSTNNATGGIIQLTIPPNLANAAQFYRAIMP